MNARDDYPWPAGEHQAAVRQHGSMCREIDRLRGENKDLRAKADGWADSAAQANRSAAEAWVRVHTAEQEAEQLKAAL